jgi:hypothetical protein
MPNSNDAIPLRWAVVRTMQRSSLFRLLIFSTVGLGSGLAQQSATPPPEPFQPDTPEDYNYPFAYIIYGF